ncbi:hypothetical protein KRX54_00860 [Actinomycetaceae bacterium TAE3-ERU4]|nr:hypothetical protein [Actinomycetaceae bacterium TAE3-ERU4]
MTRPRKKSGAVLALCLLSFLTTACSSANRSLPTLKENTPTVKATSESPVASKTPVNSPQVRLPFETTLAKTKLLEATVNASLSSSPGEWKLGGDFSVIAALPLSATEIFGSVSKTPQKIDSYDPAIISAKGNTSLRSHQDDKTYYEPQDATAKGKWIVWRESRLSNIPGQVPDDWRLVSYDRELKESKVLGTAKELNGTDQTPSVSGESLPVILDKKAYFCTALKKDTHWDTRLISVPLNGNSKPQEEAKGCWPATTQKEVFYLANPLANVSEIRQLGSHQHRGRITSSNWGFSGLWANNLITVAAVSSRQDNGGTYAAIWKNDNPQEVTWIHFPSPSIFASIGAQKVAFGSGSESLNPQMTLWSWGEEKLTILGTAHGYSRPVLAPDGSAILVPHQENGQVSWDLRKP